MVLNTLGASGGSNSMAGVQKAASALICKLRMKVFTGPAHWMMRYLTIGCWEGRGLKAHGV